EQSRPAARRQPARHAIVEEAEHFDIEPWRGDNTLRELLAELRRAADDDFPARISSRARSMNDARCGNLTEPQQDRRGDGPSDQYAPIEALREACDLEQCPNEDDDEEPPRDDVDERRQRKRLRTRRTERNGIQDLGGADECEHG